MSGKPYQISEEDRAGRSARMRARNSDPAFIAKRKRHGKRAWSPESRQAQADRLALLRTDPGFVARQKAGRERMKPRPLSVPQNAMAIVRGLFVEMNTQLATLGDVSTRSGVAYDTVRNWRRGAPHADLLEAALNTLDLELAIVPIGTRDENGFVTRKVRNLKTGVNP